MSIHVTAHDERVTVDLDTPDVSFHMSTDDAKELATKLDQAVFMDEHYDEWLARLGGSHDAEIIHLGEVSA